MIKRDKLGRFTSAKKTQKRAVAKKPVKSVKSTSSKKPTKKAAKKSVRKMAK